MEWSDSRALGRKKLYSNIFFEEAKENSTNSRNWLRVGVALAVLFVISIIVINVTDWLIPFEVILGDDKKPIFNESGELVTKLNIRKIIAQILIFAVQIYFIGFAIKQHTTNKHLFTVNKHRQNALDSYDLFKESIKEEDVATRNSLVLEIAKTIYSPGQTGYLGSKEQIRT